MRLTDDTLQELEDAGMPGLPEGYFYEVEYDVGSEVLALKIVFPYMEQGIMEKTQVLADVRTYTGVRSDSSIDVVVQAGKKAYGQAFPDKEWNYHRFVGEFSIEQKPNVEEHKPDVAGMTIYTTPPAKYIMLNIDGREIARAVWKYERGLDDGPTPVG